MKEGEFTTQSSVKVPMSHEFQMEENKVLHFYLIFKMCLFMFYEIKNYSQAFNKEYILSEQLNTLVMSFLTLVVVFCTVRFWFAQKSWLITLGLVSTHTRFFVVVSRDFFVTLNLSKYSVEAQIERKAQLA